MALDLSKPATSDRLTSYGKTLLKPDWLLEQQEVINGTNYDLAAILRTLRRADVTCMLDAALVGSKYTADPKMANDSDVLVLVKDKAVARTELISGFEDIKRGGSENEHQPDCWESFKVGKLNVLVTEDEEFFKQFKLAAEVCRYLKLQDKGQRVAVHMILMDGFVADQLIHTKEQQWN